MAGAAPDGATLLLTSDADRRVLVDPTVAESFAAQRALILRDARKLAEAEVRDSGRLIRDMVPQVTYLGQAFHYFGDLRDKIDGAVIPLDRKGTFNFTRHEPLGVVAGLWTRDFARAMRMAEVLQAGSVWINCYRPVSFLSPFGGYKDSGIGRENGIDAVKVYLQTNSVWMNTGAPTPNPYAA